MAEGYSRAELIQELRKQGVPESVINTMSEQDMEDALEALLDRSVSRNTTSVRTYTTFTNDDIIKNSIKRITDSMWSDETGSLSAFYTSSEQKTQSGNYYYNIFNLDPQIDVQASTQFAITYGNVNGSGSLTLDNDLTNETTEPTKGIYSQYRNILLDSQTSMFKFGGDFISSGIYVINFQRERFKQKIDAGNWELKLEYTGSVNSGSLNLIDDSGQQNDLETSRGGRIYNVVQGNLTYDDSGGVEISASAEPSGGIGLFYPDVGIIILNQHALDYSLGLDTDMNDTGSGGSWPTDMSAQNQNKLFQAIDSGSLFSARNVEMNTSTHYFIRIKSKDYNFSNNPTFFNVNDGKISNTNFIGDPKVYITTVGLYNNNNELIAIGKVTQPLKKSFEDESLLKVKLNF